eukprot:m.66172 g.66172  ORF g.66172 m.66172 type:complete len:609 (+) comp14043_c0_seq2:271-2097(+)
MEPDPKRAKDGAQEGTTAGIAPPNSQALPEDLSSLSLETLAERLAMLQHRAARAGVACTATGQAQAADKQALIFHIIGLYQQVEASEQMPSVQPDGTLTQTECAWCKTAQLNLLAPTSATSHPTNFPLQPGPTIYSTTSVPHPNVGASTSSSTAPPTISQVPAPASTTPTAPAPTQAHAQAANATSSTLGTQPDNAGTATSTRGKSVRVRNSRTSGWVRMLVKPPNQVDPEVASLVAQQPCQRPLTLSECNNLRSVMLGRNRMRKLRGFCNCHYENEQGERMTCNPQEIGKIFAILGASACLGIECARARSEIMKRLPCGSLTCSPCRGANQLKLCEHCNSITSSMKGNSGQCQHCHAKLVPSTHPKRQSQPKFKDYAKYKQELLKLLKMADASGYPLLIATHEPVTTATEPVLSQGQHLRLMGNRTSVDVFAHCVTPDYNVKLLPNDVDGGPLDTLNVGFRRCLHPTQAPPTWVGIGPPDVMSTALLQQLKNQNPSLSNQPPRTNWPTTGTVLPATSVTRGMVPQVSLSLNNSLIQTSVSHLMAPASLQPPHPGSSMLSSSPLAVPTPPSVSDTTACVNPPHQLSGEAAETSLSSTVTSEASKPTEE